MNAYRVQQMAKSFGARFGYGIYNSQYVITISSVLDHDVLKDQNFSLLGYLHVIYFRRNFRHSLFSMSPVFNKLILNL